MCTAPPMCVSSYSCSSRTSMSTGAASPSSRRAASSHEITSILRLALSMSSRTLRMRAGCLDFRRWCIAEDQGLTPRATVCQRPRSLPFAQELADREHVRLHARRVEFEGVLRAADLAHTRVIGLVVLHHLQRQDPEAMRPVLVPGRGEIAVDRLPVLSRAIVDHLVVREERHAIDVEDLFSVIVVGITGVALDEVHRPLHPP